MIHWYFKNYFPYIQQALTYRGGHWRISVWGWNLRQLCVAWLMMFFQLRDCRWKSSLSTVFLNWGITVQGSVQYIPIESIILKNGTVLWFEILLYNTVMFRFWKYTNWMVNYVPILGILWKSLFLACVF